MERSECQVPPVRGSALNSPIHYLDSSMNISQEGLCINPKKDPPSLLAILIVPLKYIEYGVSGDLSIIYTQSHILSTQGGL